MKENEKEIIRFIEPVLHFCMKRLNNRCDAEDLASEIFIHILSGIKKYDIDSFEKWVWRIAHNRYARFIQSRASSNVVIPDDEIQDLADDYDFVDTICITDEFSDVFRYLHTLSAEYKNIFVDYYVEKLAVKVLSKKYKLTESTVKWRLNIGREKIKKRIGENYMEKVYKRINMNTTTCNGNMDSNKYLYSQIARAICLSAYEKPLTVEEISLDTGLPTMYIEDELPRLIYGDAINQNGKKYSTDFIILRLTDEKTMIDKFMPLVKDVADYFEKVYTEAQGKVLCMSFYGSQFGMNRLGYISLSSTLREIVSDIKESEERLKNGPYPPRKDGGYGWFVVDETEDESESLSPFASGSNQSAGSPRITDQGILNYYWIGKYFDIHLYSQGTDWLFNRGIIQKAVDGTLPNGIVSEDEKANLLKLNLIETHDESYKLRFPCFTPKEYEEFSQLFKIDSKQLRQLLHGLIIDIWNSFRSFVPKRLYNQINQYVSCYVHDIIGFVAEELISRGVLELPSKDKPLVNGISYIKGIPNKVL